MSTIDIDRNTADDWYDEYPIADDEPGGAHDEPAECPASGGSHHFVEDWVEDRYFARRVVYCDECGAEPPKQAD